MVSNDIFVLSPDKSDELVSSLDGSNPEDTSASSSLVQSLVGQYKKALEKERTVFLIMLGLYGLVILFSLLALLWNETLGPRWRKKRSHPDFKEFQLEKQPQDHGGMPMTRLRHGTAHKANQVGNKIGSLVASPLARLRHKKSIRRRQGVTEATFSNVTPVDTVRASEMQQRTFSPPPAYPVPERSYWLQQPSTVSLLGALNLPDQSQSQPQSRQSLASVQPSSAGVSPTTSAPISRPSREPAHPSRTPPIPLPYLYGKPIESTTPARPPRPASHFNPFVTPFDGPNGL